MANRVELTGKNEFQQWLSTTPDCGRFRYGRLLRGPDTLVLSSREAVPDANNARAEPEVFAPLVLPTPDQAVRWWDELWEQDVMDCWVGRHLGETVLCMAMAGVWKPTDSLFAEMQKDDFRMVLEKELGQWIDLHLRSQMVNEARLVGFSVRVAVPRGIVERSKPKGRKGARHS